MERHVEGRNDVSIQKVSCSGQTNLFFLYIFEWIRAFALFESTIVDGLMAERPNALRHSVLVSFFFFCFFFVAETDNLIDTFECVEKAAFH